jgi:hypothetical protein
LDKSASCLACEFGGATSSGTDVTALRQLNYWLRTRCRCALTHDALGLYQHLFRSVRALPKFPTHDACPPPRELQWKLPDTVAQVRCGALWAPCYLHMFVRKAIYC